MTSYEKIEALRDTAGLNKKEMSALMDVTFQAYNRWRQNNAAPDKQLRRAGTEVQRLIHDRHLAALAKIDKILNNY